MNLLSKILLIFVIALLALPAELMAQQQDLPWLQQPQSQTSQNNSSASNANSRLPLFARQQQDPQDSQQDDIYKPQSQQDQYAQYQYQQVQPEFVAFISKESVAVGQSFQVKLELKNADPHTSPDISLFPDELEVVNQTQQNSVSIINGVTTKTLSWVYDVVADKPTTLKVPAISVQTDSGTLYSKPFRVYVKDVGDLPSNTEDKSIFIQAAASKNDPFIEEPVEYSIKVFHLDPLQNAELEKPKVDNATIEQLTDTKNSIQILNGRKYNVTAVTYLVVPVKSGDVVIEPSVLKGQRLVQVKQKKKKRSFNDFFDPFSMINDSFSFTRELVPFTVASNKVRLKVQPVRTGITPWNVFYDLEIEDEVSDVDFDQGKSMLMGKVGEPINRKVMMTGYGKPGDQLPDLEDLMKSKDFKIYADKPQTVKEIIASKKTDNITAKIRGKKTQLFTFIPEKKGNLVLPEIRIDYWSLKDNKPAKVILPGKVIKILPGDNVISNNTKKNEDIKQDDPDIDSVISNNKLQENSGLLSKLGIPLWALLLIVILVLILIILILKLLTKERRENQEFLQDIDPKSAAVIKKANKKQKKEDLLAKINNSEDAKQLCMAVKEYAHHNFDIPKNSSMTIIMRQLVRKYKLGTDKVKPATDLDAAVDHGKKINFAKVKGVISEIFTTIESRKQGDTKDKLTKLNPV